MEGVPYGEGVTNKEWRELLDQYLSSKTMVADLYAKTNEGQRFMIQEIKKSFARIKNKNND